MDVIDFYTQLLNAAGCHVSEYSSIESEFFGEYTPIKVSGKQLMLPTREVLTKAAWDSWIAFHPVSESATRAESPVFKQLRAMMQFRATVVISELLMQLMSIAVNKDLHPKLTPDQTEFLTKLPNDLTQDTLTRLESVLKATGGKSQNKLISMYLKRGGKLDGVEYRRLAVTEFPIMEAVASDDLKIFGVDVKTKRDKRAILKLFEWLLPECNQKAFYAGSQDISAPGFIALCSSYAKVMSRLNRVVEIFGSTGLLGDANSLMTPMGWLDGLDKIDHYRAAIPTLAGNEGDIIQENPASGNVVNGTVQTKLPSEVPLAPLTPAAPKAGLAAPVPVVKRSMADFIGPIETNEAPKRSNEPYGSGKGEVYREAPPAPAPTMAINNQLPVWNPQAALPANYPNNAGYTPNGFGVATGGAQAPQWQTAQQPVGQWGATQAPQWQAAPAAPQWAAAAPAQMNLVQIDQNRFPAPPPFVTAGDTVSGKIMVVDTRTNQVVGTYDQLLQAAGVVPQQNVGFGGMPQPINTREMAMAALAQKDYARQQNHQLNQPLPNWNGTWR